MMKNWRNNFFFVFISPSSFHGVFHCAHHSYLLWISETVINSLLAGLLSRKKKSIALEFIELTIGQLFDDGNKKEQIFSSYVIISQWYTYRDTSNHDRYEMEQYSIVFIWWIVKTKPTHTHTHHITLHFFLFNNFFFVLICRHVPKAR